jgi:hypothetical protein
VNKDMGSNLLPLLPFFSGYLIKHGFIEVERKTIMWGQEVLFRSPAIDLRIVFARGEVHIEAKPADSDDEWYDIQTILEMEAGVTPKLLDVRNASQLASEMETTHEKWTTFFSVNQSDRTKKYSLWIEGSYWGEVLRTRALRDAQSASKPWWKIW